MKLQLRAPLNLMAAKADKPRRFKIVAYNGGALRIEGFEHPVVVDLAGLTTAGTIPLLLDHEASVEATLGSITEIVNDGRRLTIAGPVTGQSPRALNVLAASDAGHQWGASVGAVIEVKQDVPAGVVVNVNGRDIRGPVIVARRAELRETSVLPAAADNSTTVNLAAAAALAKGNAMNFEQWCANQEIDPAKLTDAAKAALMQAFDAEQAGAPAVPAAAGALVNLRAAHGGEHRRIAEINALTVKHPHIGAKAIEAGWSPIETELAVMKTNLRATAPVNFTASGSMGTSDQKTLEAALLCRAGRDELAGKVYGDQTASAARALRAKSLPDLAAMALTLEGREVPQGRSEMIRAAFSTLSLPTALSNTTGKALWEAYREQPATWRSFSKILPAADFKPQTGVRPSFFTNLSEVGAGGSISHGSLSESTFPWSIGTYAKMFSITRQTVINDDLGFLDGLPSMMAKSALRTLSDLIWTTILANAGSFYASGNGNYQEGAGTSLQVSSLQSLVTLMRTQRDATGNDLDIVPKTLVVPPELETTARALLNSELLGRDDEQPTGNPLKSIAALEVESRISNSVKFTGNSTTAFYLFAAPQDAPVIVGFLDGAETPVVETFGLDHDVNTLGMSFRCYHDFGTAFGDHRATAKSKGAA